jgi:Lytic transglycolase/IstB-like ATP binding protein
VNGAPIGFLEALVRSELEERDQRLIERRIREARLPRMKPLNKFDFACNLKVSAQQIQELARRRIEMIRRHEKIDNLKTGKSTGVTVTDRGPALGSHRIDLSKKAAKDIGLTHKEGIAPVKIKVTHTPGSQETTPAG